MSNIPSNGTAREEWVEQTALDRDPEVIAANAQASEAEALANSLEDAIRSGDAEVTHDKLTEQKSLVSFLRLQVEGARTKARQRRIDARDQAIADIKKDVLKKTPESGQYLVEALEAVRTAAMHFAALADEHNADLARWRVALGSHGFQHQQFEQGIGVNGIGILLVDGSELPIVDPGNYLRLIFAGVPSDARLKPLPDDYDTVQSAYKSLRSTGKAS